MLNELEYVVLGILSDKQPCTAYAVRRVFLTSPSSHWSGSAGAIYPLVRRLEKRRLVRSEARRADGRSSRLYQLTKPGLRELRTWLRPPLPPAAGLMNIDPLRVRVRFLEVLDVDERLAVVDEAAEKLRDHLKRIEPEALQFKIAGDMFSYLIGRGAALSVRAQLTWLKEVCATLRAEKVAG